MSSNAHARLQQLYEQARQLDREQRQRFVEIECANDSAELRRELESMLEVDEPRRGPLGNAWTDRETGSQTTESLMLGNERDRWGSLEIVEKVGEGGFGEVFRARDTKLDREVALKLLKHAVPEVESANSTVIREARLLAKVKHPNVLTVYGADCHDGRVGIWTEFVRGKTFEQLAREHGRLGPDEAVILGIDLTRGLAAIHDAGLVHGDVKPQNVMRQEGGQTLLMDLGAGRETKASRESAEGVSGTPRFMAPELFRGEMPSVASDIYALGITLCYLVSLRFPIEERSILDLRRKHERRERVPIRDLRADLPSGIVEVLERATAHDPTNRFKSAGEMEQALRATLGIDYTGTTDAPRSNRKSWRLASVLAVVMLVVAGGWLARNYLKERPLSTYTVEAAFMVEKGLADDLALVQGAEVQPGDELYVQFKSSRDVYVYVINEDLNGESWLLFPMHGYPLANPLGADRAHRLPGTDHSGKPLNWEVTSRGGQEQFLVVASPERLIEFEARIGDIPSPDFGTPQRLDRGTLGVLRGVGGLAEAEPAHGSGSRLLDVYAPLTAEVEEVEGVWTRRLVVDNP